MPTSKVFISYSHDSDEHIDWVFGFAAKLVRNGVDVILDKWDLKPGKDLTKFMEDGLTNSEKVLVICTPNYVHKSNNNLGGVGYETILVKADLLKDLSSEKFIPIIRETPISIPKFLGTRLYIDFTDNNNFDTNFEYLLRELHSQPKFPKPELGNNPFTNNSNLSLDITKEPYQEARFPISTWLQSGGNIEFIRPFMVKWLEIYSHTVQASFVLNSWINARGDLEVIKPFMLNWLELHGHTQEANFILTAWLNNDGNLELIKPFLNEWLNRFS